MDEALWAEDEFGAARLGDARRERRLLSMAADAARRPNGRLSDVFGKGARVEAAYRAVETDAFDYTDLSEAAQSAAFGRALEEPVLLAPVDGTSLTLESVPDDELGP